MPGLVGIISDNVADRHLLDRMADSVRHEAWYRTDKYTGGAFNIARVHLGIFNPEPQPIFNENRTLCIFMDGKIYGYDEDRTRLEGKYRFKSNDDPEFCLHLYEEYGRDFLKKLNGSFVLLICDFGENRVIIANDRNGLRSSYYAINNGRLLFAPEAKAILHDDTFKKELNDVALAESFAFGEFWGGKTLFRGINALPPASVLTYSKGQISLDQYWNFSYQPDYSLSEERIVGQLVEAFRKAVSIRMKDDLRYGIELSGGLDSRAVLAGVEPEKRKGMISYSFGPLDCDELKVAGEVARRCGTAHRTIEITPELIIQNAEQEVWLSDGRDNIGVSYIHPVHRVIRGDVDVTFDGFEQDVTLGGSYLRKNLIHYSSQSELFGEVFNRRRGFSEGELQRLLTPEYYERVKDVPRESLRAELDVSATSDPRTVFDEFFWRTHVAYWSIGHMYIRDLVEIACPTFDNNFLDIVYRIPPEKRLGHYMYRKFLLQLSPELSDITYNQMRVAASAPLIFWKLGKISRHAKERLREIAWMLSGGRIYIPSRFDWIKLKEWLRADENWRRYFKELLLDESAMSREYLNQEYIKHLIHQHEVGRRDNSAKIMRLATFELFLRKFMI
ncbi:MAG: hypothetical protein HY672_03020 [Chloroflexi bacterium]|nr:hypothetical protein [Chloroflexota bacterium]